MDEVGSMPTSSIKIVRACHYRLRTYWNYVGRHGADKSSTYYTRGLSGGQFTAHKAYSEMLSLVIFGEVSGYYPNPTNYTNDILNQPAGQPQQRFRQQLLIHNPIFERWTFR